MANIMDLLQDSRKTIEVNDNISLPYISYQVRSRLRKKKLVLWADISRSIFSSFLSLLISTDIHFLSLFPGRESQNYFFAHFPSFVYGFSTDVHFSSHRLC